LCFVDATVLQSAEVQCASDVIITVGIYSSVGAFSKVCIAFVLSASDVIITVGMDWLVMAVSSSFVAEIVGAFDLVPANLVFMDAGSIVTDVDSAKITILTSSVVREVDTFAKFCAAEIVGAIVGISA
jgi:hypothetical protein